MKVTATFRPSIITPLGTWHIVTGDWDGSVLWFDIPEGQHKGRRVGVHLNSRVVFEPAAEAKEACANDPANWVEPQSKSQAKRFAELKAAKEATK